MARAVVTVDRVGMCAHRAVERASLVLILPLLLVASARAQSAVTFNEIAPILYRECSSCHRPGQPAPFAMLRYEDVKPHARRIAEQTRRRAMPPWLPEPGHGEFRNERRLSDVEIELIQRWVEGGAIEGDVRRAPAPPRWPDEWHLGRPDLVVTLPQPYTLQAHGSDVFRNFVIPLPLDTARYVKAVEFRPGNQTLVHHAVISADSTPASRHLDEADPEPGFDGMLHGGADSPQGHLLGWTPGKTPTVGPDDMAWRLERRSDLVVQLHMMPKGRPEPVQFQVGLFFTDTPPARVPFSILLGSRTIDIPPGEKDYSIADTYVLPADVDLLSIYPHAHYLAKEMKASATLPDGAIKRLLWIKDWNFNWQDVYKYATSVPLPRGTTIQMTYTFDNSPDNTRNPNRPVRRVGYGPHATDEMADLWLQVVPRTPDGVAALERLRDERELHTAIAVSENVLRRDSANAEEHNRQGARYLEAQKLEDAIRHFQEAVRLDPKMAAAHTNLGNAFQLQGDLGEAVVHFRRAIASNPQFAEAHNNLAVVLVSQGQIDEGVEHLRRAVALSPGSGQGHASLGVALALQGHPDEALLHLRRALEINPDDAGARDTLHRLEQLLGLPRSGREM